MKIKFKLITSFAIIIALTLVLGVITILNIEIIHEKYLKLAEHDIVVLENSQLLQKFIIDAETGERGFIITGDEEFLEPYYSGVENFDLLINSQKDLISDNPSQMERLNKIESLFDEWINFAAKPEIEMGRLVAANLKSNVDLDKILSDGEGKSIIDQIRILLNELNTNLIESRNLEAQLLVSQIGKDVVDQETGQRGFIITGDEEFLEPFKQSESLLKTHFKELRILLEGDEVNLEILQLIEDAHKEWLLKAGNPEIQARRNVNENPETFLDAAALLKNKTGKNILDNIRDEFKKFIEIERENTKTDLDIALETKNNITNTFILGSTVIITLGIAIALYSANAYTKPLIKLGHAAKMVAARKEAKIDIKGNDEITDLSRSFKQMSDDLRELDKKKEEFISMVSHELKTPLVPIALYAELLLDTESMGKLNEAQTDAVKSIHESMNDLKTLIGDVLDINKLELGKLKLRKRVVNVQDFVNETFEKLKPFTEPAQAKLILDMNIDGQMDVDTNRVFQVISNLVKNSIKFVPENTGVITIRVNDAKHAMILFSIEDNGAGISLDDQGRLFQKFYQIDSSTTRDHGGTGLGLSISQGIVENHGGKIWYDNDYKDGAKFKFTLPRIMK